MEENCDYGKIATLSISPDNTRLALGRLYDIEIWQFPNCKKLHSIRLDKKRNGPVLKLAFSPNGTRVAAGMWAFSNSLNPTSTAEMLRVWDVATGKQTAAFWKNEDITGIAFSPDGKLLAATRLKTLGVWDIDNKRQVYEIQVDEKGANCVAFSPDGKMLATGGGEPAIKLWEVSSGKAIGELVGHTKWVSDLAFSGDGKMLVSAGADRQVLIWPIENRRIKE